MARLVTSGAEISGSQNVSPEHNPPDGFAVIAGMSRTTSVARSGAASWVYTGGGQTYTVFNNVALSASTTYWWRVFFNIGTAGDNTTGKTFIMGFGNGTFPVVISTTQATGADLFDQLILHDLTTGGGDIGSPTGHLNVGQWYMVELKAVLNASALITSVEFRLDGVVIASGNLATPTGATGVNLGNTGSSAFSGISYNYDDVALNDSNGANQNSYPGDGHVVFLAPVSDNANGTGWTNDAAGTTNLFDAVNNIPPVGIADTTGSTGLHQIRNATSNANVNYDSNLQTYLNAGLNPTDVVQVIVPVIATAAPVTTSAKAGTVGVASNPTIANVSLGAAGTSGAFWSGIAAGTYPTGWKWSYGTVTYLAAVTKASSPVMRVTQVTSSTRIAMVCAMGLYVEYTIVPPVRPVVVGFAVERVSRY